MSDPDERFEDQPETCSACGARVDAEVGRAFGFGTENVLCWSCAATRGGRYDAARDLWDPPPDLSGLPYEAYGASPHEIRRKRR